MQEHRTSIFSKTGTSNRAPEAAGPHIGAGVSRWEYDIVCLRRESKDSGPAI